MCVCVCVCVCVCAFNHFHATHKQNVAINIMPSVHTKYCRPMEGIYVAINITAATYQVLAYERAFMCSGLVTLQLTNLKWSTLSIELSGLQ